MENQPLVNGPSALEPAQLQAEFERHHRGITAHFDDDFSTYRRANWGTPLGQLKAEVIDAHSRLCRISANLGKIELAKAYAVAAAHLGIPDDYRGELEELSWVVVPGGLEKIPAVTRYDYTNQAWLVDGLYTDCSHPPSMRCRCFGRLHLGEAAREGAEIQ
jgi:hypothetical protein